MPKAPFRDPELEDDSAPEFVVRLFGALSVTCLGKPLPKMRSRSEYWLLALLVLRASESPCERTRLAGMLWPETGETAAASNLRRSLRLLRQALGSQAIRIQSPTWSTLFLDLSGGAWCDLRDFDSAVRAGDEASLARAAEIYRGPLLLDCLEDWIVADREARADAALRVLERLADKARDRGDLPLASSYLKRILQIDPHCETALRSLMTVLVGLGSHAAAHEYFRAFRASLRRDLNAEPSPETSLLAHRIQAEARIRASRSAAIPGGRAGHPALKDNLPRHLSRFIGRETERETVHSSLAAHRLVTVTGTAGIGKTRLAIAVAQEAAEDFVDGVCFVELAPLTDPDLLPLTLLSALGGRQSAGDTHESTVVEFISEKQILIVLDNCEHLVAPCARFVQLLLRRCPRLCLLATSREPLRVPVEAVRQTGGLSGESAAELFGERAAQVRSTFDRTPATVAAIDRICARLEGIPLAIELAAARTRGLSVAQIATNLDGAFRLLNLPGGNQDPRHQTIHAALDWSYDLLSQEERALLSRLSIFVGGWTFEAAIAICADDLLDADAVVEHLLALVDKSLVDYAETACGVGRYRLLEVTRAYAGTKLGDLESSRFAARHAAYFADQVGIMWSLQGGPDEPQAIDRMETDLANARLAIDWYRSSGEVTEALRTAWFLGRLWTMRGRLKEGKAYVDALLALPSDDDPGYSLVRCNALNLSGLIASYSGDYLAAKSQLEQALEISRALNNWGLTTKFLFNLGPVLMELGHYADARRAVMETWELNEVHGYPAAVAHCRVEISRIDIREGDLDGAERKLRSAIETFDSLNSTYWKALALHYLSDVAEARCVRATVEDARDAKREWEDRNTALGMFHAMHYVPAIVVCLDGFARRAARHGDFRRMAILHGSCEALRVASDAGKMSPYFRAFLERDIERARAAVGEAALAAALAGGRTLTMDRAVEFASDE